MCDVLRHCYKKWVWFDALHTIGAWIMWYRCEPGAKRLPGRNVFSAEIWDPVHWYGGPIGEAWNTGREYYLGTNPLPSVFKGQKFCGRPEWFANGVPTGTPRLRPDIFGFPACCHPAHPVGAYNDAYDPSWDTAQ